MLKQAVHMAQTQAHTIDGILLTKFDTIDDKARSLLACTDAYVQGMLRERIQGALRAGHNHLKLAPKLSKHYASRHLESAISPNACMMCIMPAHAVVHTS